MHSVTVNSYGYIKHLILIFLLGSACSSAAEQYTQYITYLNCAREVIDHEHEVNKIYEPVRGLGIESLSYSLDQKKIVGVNEYRRLLDENGHTKAKPAIALRLENGWLAGVFSEAFGGEVVFIDESMKARHLIDGAVLDMFEVPLGIVVITRASLLLNAGGNNIYLLIRGVERFEVNKLFTLSEVPLSANKLKDGGVLIVMKNARVVFTSMAELHRVQCESANAKGYRND